MEKQEKNDIIHKFLVWYTKLIKKELTEEREKSFRQFLRFCIVGTTNTGVSYAAYALALLIFEKTGVAQQYNHFLSMVVAFITSVLWAFFWSNKLVFKKAKGKERNLWAALGKTFLSYAFTGLFLANVLLYLWVDVLHIPKLIAPLISLCFTFPLNFIFNKFWAFRDKDKKKESTDEA